VEESVNCLTTVSIKQHVSLIIETCIDVLVTAVLSIHRSITVMIIHDNTPVDVVDDWCCCC